MTRVAPLRMLLIAPALGLLLFILVYGVNGPTWDHLSSAEIFDRWYSHRFTIDFLFRQHNEHRKAVPRLVMLALGLLTRFNNKAEMVFQAILISATVSVMFRAFRRITGLDSGARIAAFLPVAWMMFSLRPYEVLLVGDGLVIYLVSFMVGTLYLLTSEPFGWKTLCGAAGLGVLSSYTQSNGLLIWPLGALILAVNWRRFPSQAGRSTLAYLVLWIAAGAIVSAAYLRGYVDPPNHPSVRVVFEHPLQAIQYFVVLCGGSLAADRSEALAAGLIALALEAYFTILVVGRWMSRAEPPPFGFWLMLLAFMSETMVTANRAGFGIGQALAPRYATLSALGPIGAYWCAVEWRDRLGAKGLSVAGAAGLLLIAGCLAGSIDALALRNWLYGEHRWSAYLLYTASFQTGATLEKHVYPNPDHARAYAAALEHYRLNVFARPPISPIGLEPDARPPLYALEFVQGKPTSFDQIVHVSAEDALTLDGWAVDADGRHSVAEMYVNVDGAKDILACVALERDTLHTTLPRALRWTGFRASFGGFVLDHGAHDVALKMISADGRHLFVTKPLFRVVRD